MGTHFTKTMNVFSNFKSYGSLLHIITRPEMTYFPGLLTRGSTDLDPNTEMRSLISLFGSLDSPWLSPKLKATLNKNSHCEQWDPKSNVPPYRSIAFFQDLQMSIIPQK